MSGKNPIEKALEKAKGLKTFIQKPTPLSNEERQVAMLDLKLISGWLISALTTSPENAYHLKDASKMASELLQTIKNYSQFPSLLTERDRTLVPILQKQIQSKLDLVLKDMASLPPAFAAVKKEEDGKEEEEEEEEDDVEVFVPQDKKLRTVQPDPTQSTTQGGRYHPSGANVMGGPMPFFHGPPQYTAGPMYYPGFAPGVAPYAVANNPPYAGASNPGILPHYHGGPPQQGMAMAPAPFPYQQAPVSYNNVTPNHQGYGTNGSRTTEANAGPTFAASASAGPTMAAAATGGNVNPPVAAAVTRGTAAKRGTFAAENGAEPNAADPSPTQPAFDWAKGLFENRSLRGDFVSKKSAPHLFRSINLYIPVLGDEKDLYKCLSLLGWGREEMVPPQVDPAAPAEDTFKNCLEEIGTIENKGGNKTNVLLVLQYIVKEWLKVHRRSSVSKGKRTGSVPEMKKRIVKLLVLVYANKNSK